MGYINGNKVFQVVRTEHILSVDDELSTVSENPVQNKVVTQALNGKVDKVEGKGLSTNDFTDALKSKVEEVDNKANTSDLENGTVVVSKAISSKSIENVSEESGSTQEDPFIHQGTGTENNTSETPTSPVAKQLEKQGNTIAYIQLAKELASGNWHSTNSNASYSNGVATFTVTNQYGNIHLNNSSDNLIAGHKYLINASIKLTTGTTSVFIDIKSGSSIEKRLICSNATTKQTFTDIFECSANGLLSILITDSRASDWDAIEVSDVYLIDVTQWFNDNIPQDLLDNPSHFSWYYNGDLTTNAGLLKNSNGRYLKCTHRQQWDEQWELGSINDNGANVSNSQIIRSKNYIRAIPNRTYAVNSRKVVMYEYDENKTFIRMSPTDDLLTYGYLFTLSSNTRYIRFRTISTYGTTYNHDITISLYYETGDGYDQYYAYEEPNVYDTGTEVLRKAGSFKDVKLPSGEITRNVDENVFTGNETWNFNPTYDFFYFAHTGHKVLTYAEKIMSSNGIVCSLVNENYVYAYLSDNPQLTSESNMNLIFPSGTKMNYPLATPTTEQGTPFAENIEIDDYGTMEWLDTNEDPVEIPQGVKIFYPADYVLLIDDLNSYTDGDVTKLAKKTDLVIPTPPTTDGTYTLKVTIASGTPTYTWVLDE